MRLAEVPAAGLLRVTKTVEHRDWKGDEHVLAPGLYFGTVLEELVRVGDEACAVKVLRLQALDELCQPDGRVRHVYLQTIYSELVLSALEPVEAEP